MGDNKVLIKIFIKDATDTKLIRFFFKVIPVKSYYYVLCITLEKYNHLSKQG